jgi:HK97 gp10 family phage protein
MNARIQGIVEARRAFARIPEAVRDAINDVNETTAREIVRGAQARVRRRSGLLARSISYSIDKRRGTAKVGVESGPAFYGHFLEFGTIHQKARPFMLPAVEAERGYHEQRFRESGKQQIEGDIGKVGGRVL